MNLNKVEVVKSAATKKDFINSSLPQIVFAGKSNVGKSSVINKLFNRKNFARVGATPGKTVHVNYFLVDGGVYFVDLPGYGFAKVSKDERDRWGKLMESFFETPDEIRLGVLIVDARHRPTADDVTMSDYFKNTGIPYIILANKNDKVKPSQREALLLDIKNTLCPEDGIPIIPFSAETGENRNKLIAELERYI